MLDSNVAGVNGMEIRDNAVSRQYSIITLKWERKVNLPELVILHRVKHDRS